MVGVRHLIAHRLAAAGPALGAVLGAGIDALRYDHSPVHPLRRDAGLGAARGKTVAVAFRLSF